MISDEDLQTRRGEIRTILLALCGLSPGVITETAWALSREQPSTRVDKVVAFTTQRGAAAIEKELLTNGIWERLRSSLKAEKGTLIFGRSGDSIRIIADARASGLDDIDNSDDSFAAADFILENLRQFTENPDCRVVFSIAGGRKTMSALAALCMTLLGRRCDRLCHVLVNAPFDSPALHPKFYFPEEEVTHIFENAEYSSTSARICLHDIPYVRCRDVYQKEYSRLPGTFLTTVEAANRLIVHPRVEINPSDNLCLIDDEPLSLSPAEYAFFWFFSERRWEEKGPINNATTVFYDFIDFIKREDIQGYLWQMHPHLGKSSLGALMAGDDSPWRENSKRAAYVRRLANRIGTKLKKMPNQANLKSLHPSRGRNQGYGLEIPPENITVPTD